MNARRSAFPAMTALVLSFASPARAWGPVGHKAVAMIAQSRLSLRALRAVDALLAPGVGLDKIANCADEFAHAQDRDCAGVFTITGDPLATKPWHFIDIPISSDADATSIMRDCAQDACVVAQIRKDAAILQDPSASPDDKRMALMYLVHFVGDVHQPLHNVADDFGGNLKIMHNILLSGKPVNLHSIWDSEIDDPAKVDYRLPEEDLTAEAAALARALEGGIRDESSWTSGDTAAAASLESHAIAQTVIYPDYWASHGDDELADYQRKMQPIAFRRIQMAGVRLAALLEAAFAAPAPARASAPRASAASKALWTAGQWAFGP